MDHGIRGMAAHRSWVTTQASILATDLDNDLLIVCDVLNIYMWYCDISIVVNKSVVLKRFILNRGK